MRNLITIGMILAFSSAASAQENEIYLCLAEKATGFKFQEITKKWEETSFIADGKFLIIRRAPISDNKPLIYGDFYTESEWIIKEFGEDSPIMECKSFPGENVELDCKSGTYWMSFYQGSMKFTLFYMGSYYFTNDDLMPPDLGDGAIGQFMVQRLTATPLVMIGTCTKL